MAQARAADGSPDSSLEVFLGRVSRRYLPCLHCGNEDNLNLSGENVIHTKEALLTSGYLHPRINRRCGRCGSFSPIIFGCSCKPTNVFNPNIFPYNTQGGKVRLGWCCDDGRLFLLWAVCCGITEYRRVKVEVETVEEAGTKEARSGLRPWRKKKASASATPAAPPTNEPSPDALPQGVGYNNTYPKHYFDKTLDPPETTPSSLWSILKTSAPGQNTEEVILRKYYKALTLLLESTAELPEIATLMIARSPLLPRLAELLRHSSIDYALTHKDLFGVLMRLTELMGRHRSTWSFIHLGYKVYPLEEQLLSMSQPRCEEKANNDASSTNKDGQQQAGSVLTNPAEQAPPLTECLLDLTKEAQKMLRLIERSPPAFRMTPDGHTYAHLCALISDTKKRVERGRPNTVIEAAPKKVPIITELPDDVVLSNFHFRKVARELQGFKAGRTKALYQQVASLLKNLPQENIWVRYGASRVDSMKVLIMGPKNTPYQYGLFEFDLFCDAAFPSQPPQMLFRTTGGKSPVRFNPNLYKDGKICLSLLGTWGDPVTNRRNGEAWDEKTSTLLQLLVSLQAMIFVEEPWYNEPSAGYAGKNSALSDMYSAQIRKQTVEHAILAWLKSGKATRTKEEAKASGDNIWKDVLREHYMQNGRAIVAMIEDWKALPVQAPISMEVFMARHFPGQEELVSLDTLHSQVKAELLKHGFTF